jgi:hypothetical protein
VTGYCIYTKQGFYFTQIFIDEQFELLCGDLAKLQINLNAFSKHEHLAEVKQYI